jgi:hypothetical protein
LRHFCITQAIDTKIINHQKGSEKASDGGWSLMVKLVHGHDLPCRLCTAFVVINGSEKDVRDKRESAAHRKHSAREYQENRHEGMNRSPGWHTGIW